MGKSPTGEVSFEVDGERFTLVFDFESIAFFEQASDVSMVDAMAAMEQARAQGRAPKISHLAYLLQAGFRRHHPDMTPQRALELSVNPDVQAQLGVAVEAAMPDAQDTAEDEAGNAKAPAKASTGTKSSRARSKRG